jgi:hypothetical protein
MMTAKDLKGFYGYSSVDSMSNAFQYGTIPPPDKLYQRSQGVTRHWSMGTLRIEEEKNGKKDITPVG